MNEQCLNPVNTAEPLVANSANGPIDYPVFYLISSKNIPSNGLKVIKVFSCKF